MFSLLIAYLGVTVLIQPKLRQVLRAPETNQQTTENRKPETGNQELVVYDCQRGRTAFDLLQTKTNRQVEVKDYSFGKMIQAINGIKGESNGKFWIYFVDGKSGTVSADNYHCQNQEKVEWKFIKPE